MLLLAGLAAKSPYGSIADAPRAEVLEVQHAPPASWPRAWPLRAEPARLWAWPWQPPSARVAAWRWGGGRRRRLSGRHRWCGRQHGDDDNHRRLRGRRCLGGRGGLGHDHPARAARGRWLRLLGGGDGGRLGGQRLGHLGRRSGCHALGCARVQRIPARYPPAPSSATSASTRSAIRKPRPADRLRGKAAVCRHGRGAPPSGHGAHRLRGLVPLL